MQTPPSAPAEVWYNASHFEKFLASRKDPEEARKFCLEHAIRGADNMLGWSRVFDLWLLTKFPAKGAKVFTIAVAVATEEAGRPQPWELMKHLESAEGECPFPGCAELRAEYQAEVAALGDNCGGCQLSAIRLKFLHRINERLVSDL